MSKPSKRMQVSVQIGKKRALEATTQELLLVLRKSQLFFEMRAARALMREKWKKGSILYNPDTDDILEVAFFALQDNVWVAEGVAQVFDGRETFPVIVSPPRSPDTTLWQKLGSV